MDEVIKQRDLEWKEDINCREMNRRREMRPTIKGSATGMMILPKCWKEETRQLMIHWFPKTNFG